MNRFELFERIFNDTISDRIYGKPFASSISFSNLGLDELDIIEIIMNLEDNLDIHLNHDDFIKPNCAIVSLKHVAWKEICKRNLQRTFVRLSIGNSIQYNEGWGWEDY